MAAIVTSSQLLRYTRTRNRLELILAINALNYVAISHTIGLLRWEPAHTKAQSTDRFLKRAGQPIEYGFGGSVADLPKPSGSSVSWFLDRCRSVKFSRPPTCSGSRTNLFSVTSSCCSCFRSPISYVTQACCSQPLVRMALVRERELAPKIYNIYGIFKIY